MVMKTTFVEVLEAPTQQVSQEEIPAAVQTVRADTLLKQEERKLAGKRGWIFGVEVDGRTYLVPAHRQVPAGATVPRTAAGSLIGVAAVTGG